MLRTVIIAVALAAAPVTAIAEAWSLASTGTKFQRVTDKGQFVQIIQQGDLERFGISLTVTPDGRIGGNAFGRDVTGAWQWRDGFFCRELNWGSRELDANCQAVMVSGDLVRFQSDYGKGDFADLRLR